MKRAFSCCCVLAALATAEAIAQDDTNGTWSIEGTGYTVEVGMPAANVKGASLILRSGTASANSTGRVGTTVSTDALRLRRVIVSGEIQTHDAPDGAALWLRVERGPEAAIVDYGFDGRLHGGEDWTPKTLSLPVPADATRISYGVRLWGRGAVLARGLRLETGTALDLGVPLPQSAADELDAALRIVRTQGLRRDRVSWPTLEREVRTLAAGATIPSEVYPAIRHLLAEAAHRSHSMLLSPPQWLAMTTAGARERLPDAHTLEAGVGYIDLPEHNTDSVERNREYVQRAYQLIDGVRSRAECGWVVDLRTNGGGNVYPMLAAMLPFLGSSPLGSNVGPDGADPARVARPLDNVTPHQSLSILESAPVAVLIGPATGSSGERVAISFRGRARTRIFGEPSRGATTANETFTLPDGARLVVTRTVMADRTGRVYGSSVDPDTHVPNPSNPADVATPRDEAARAAVAWLRQVSDCNAR